MSELNYMIRGVKLDDAKSRNELDRRLAKNGSGMVLLPHQIDSVDDERERIRKYLENPGATVDIVAVLDGGRVIGSAKIGQFQQALCQHVGLIAMGVDPEFQGCGVGRAIMVELLERADNQVLLRLELYVRKDNARAISLYESLGFQHEAVRKSFARLADGNFVDDLIMVKLYGEAA